MDEMEKYTLPNGEEVYFEPETHIYVVREQIVPSITTLLKLVYGNNYANVRPDVLKRSSDYGTAVHKEIQTLIEMRDMGFDISNSFDPITCQQETRNYFKFVEPIYHVKPLDVEKVVVLYDNEGKPVAAGRFDMMCEVAGQKTLADFKTTSTIHRQLVTGQLNLYLKAARQSGYLTDDEECKLAAIHLSGSKSKLIPMAILSESFIQQFYVLDTRELMEELANEQCKNQDDD